MLTPLQIFLLALIVASALMLAYPFVVFPRLLRWGRRPLARELWRRWPAPPAGPRPVASVAVLFCGYNEAAVLGDKLENLLACAARSPRPVRVYVYLDGCTDRSEEVAAAFGDRIELVVGRERRGKSAGMRTLVGRTREDLLVFTDANVLFHEESIPRLLARFDAAPRVGCILGSVRFTNTGHSTTARLEGAYWRYEENLKSLESEIGTCFCGTGACFAIRRESYVPAPDDIIDDLHTTLNVLLGGHAVIQAQDVEVYERAATRPRDEWRRKVRIACRSYNCYRLLRPRLRRLPWPVRFMFVSHKLVRWYSGVPLVVGAVAALLLAFSIATELGFAAAALGAGAAWLAQRRLRPIASWWGVGQALLASSYGVYLSFRGRRFVTWTPVASTR